jgi:hypothetical protein
MSWRYQQQRHARRKSIRKIRKSKPKLGRPVTTGIGVPVLLRMHDPLLAAVDAWIAAQDKPMSRPEGARRLTEIGLSKAKKRSP